MLEVEKVLVAHALAEDTEFIVTKVSDKLWDGGLLLLVNSLSLPELVEGLELLFVVLTELSEALSADLEIVISYVLGLLLPSL